MGFQAAVWTRKYINDLPDKCFALIELGGKKDAEGKTVPRSLRHLPYIDDKGKIDLPHLRNAMVRVTHTDVSSALQKKAHDLLLRVYKKVGMEHPKCSVPGCQRYALKKSMLEDGQAFLALQAEAYKRMTGTTWMRP
jgi:hypothetical protein